MLCAHLDVHIDAHACMATALVEPPFSQRKAAGSNPTWGGAIAAASIRVWVMLAK